MKKRFDCSRCLAMTACWVEASILRPVMTGPRVDKACLSSLVWLTQKVQMLEDITSMLS